MEPRAAVASQGLRPPAEVVLQPIYYAVLAIEAVALAALYHSRHVAAGEPLGHAIGWAGTVSMCVMHIYSIRRRVRALSRWGRLRWWLQLHIFLGLQGAMLVTFHSLHLQTLANISGVTLAMTLVVVASGIFGRYLFSLIPKGLSGDRLSARDVEKELSALRARLETAAPTEALRAALDEHKDAQPISGKAALSQLVAEDLRSRRALRHLKRAIGEAKKQAGAGEGGKAIADFASLASRRMLLARRLATLTAAERVFRNWTVLHKPLTFILLGSVLLHVISHYIYAAQFGG